MSNYDVKKISTHENPYLLSLPCLLSAKKKLGLVAAFNDPNDPALKAFMDCDNYNPTEFREQLRRNFFIHLTDEELGALITFFDKDGDRHVSGEEFFRTFFSLGQKEKTKIFLLQKEESKRRQYRQNKYLHDLRNRYEKLSKDNVSYQYNENDEKSAISKLSQAAFNFDHSSNSIDVSFIEIYRFYLIFIAFYTYFTLILKFHNFDYNFIS